MSLHLRRLRCALGWCTFSIASACTQISTAQTEFTFASEMSGAFQPNQPSATIISDADAPTTISDNGTIVSDGGMSLLPLEPNYPAPPGASTSPDYSSAAGCSTCGDTTCSCDAMCAPTCCPSPRCIVFGEYLFLRPADADLAHAQQQDGTGGAGTVPFGAIGTLELEHHSGFRLGGGIACCDCSGVEFSYTYFESDSFNSVDPPFIPGGGGAVGSLVHHPAASITASVGPVDATYEIDYQLADLVYSNQLLCGNRYVVNYLLGAQFGHLDQDFAQAGFFSGGSQGAIDTITSIDFDGAGLKAGLDSEHCFCGGLSVYGRATAAVLVGEFRGEYVMVNRTADVLLAQAIWQDNRTITQFEYELGLAWQSANQRCRFATGYMVSLWNDVVTTPEFIDAVRKDNYTNVDGELSFSGLVSRVEMRF